MSTETLTESENSSSENTNVVFVDTLAIARYANSDDFVDIQTFFPEYSADFTAPVCHWD